MEGYYWKHTKFSKLSGTWGDKKILSSSASLEALPQTKIGQLLKARSHANTGNFKHHISTSNPFANRTSKTCSGIVTKFSFWGEWKKKLNHVDIFIDSFSKDLLSSTKAKKTRNPFVSSKKLSKRRKHRSYSKYVQSSKSLNLENSVSNLSISLVKEFVFYEFPLDGKEFELIPKVVNNEKSHLQFTLPKLNLFRNSYSVVKKQVTEIFDRVRGIIPFGENLKKTLSKFLKVKFAISTRTPRCLTLKPLLILESIFSNLFYIYPSEEEESITSRKTDFASFSSYQKRGSQILSINEPCHGSNRKTEMY